MPIRKRIKWTLFTAQSFGSAGFLVASTVTPIVGARLSGRPSWAGVPTAFYWGGAALFAMVWGRLMDPLGRRRTLTLGLSLGVVGAIVAAGAVMAGSFPGFVAGLLLMGGANSSLQLARFMAGEVHQPEERGRAISTVVMGGTVGAVMGPGLVAPMSAVAESFGRPGLSGPFMASSFFFLLGSLVVFAMLRPDPRDVARALAVEPGGPRDGVGVTRSLAIIVRDPGVVVAIVTMTLAQAVMTMQMVITSLHMSHNGHVLASVAAVMSSHVFGMYALSMVAGRLADTWGRRPLIMGGATMLVASTLGAAPSVAVLPLGASLLLLGVGWNCCYVGASALLSDRLSVPERSRVQGVNDSLLTGTAAGGSLLSGVVFSHLGYTVMGLVCAVVATVPLILAWRLESTRASTGTA